MTGATNRTLLIAAMCALFTTDADAHSCIDHAWEQMDVKLVEVTSDGEVVPTPAQLHPLDKMLNSSDQGRWVLFTQKDDYGHGKFYELADKADPTPGVGSYIDASSEWTLETSCGYDVNYTPIVPGRYDFAEEHSGGEKTSRDIDDPVLFIAPDRLTATLEFSVAGVAYVAMYEITCAYFDWTQPGSKNCAVTGTPEKPEEVTIPEPPPVKPKRGCMSCTLADDGSPLGAALAIIILVAMTVIRSRRNR